MVDKVLAIILVHHLRFLDFAAHISDLCMFFVCEQADAAKLQRFFRFAFFNIFHG